MTLSVIELDGYAHVSVFRRDDNDRATLRRGEKLDESTRDVFVQDGVDFLQNDEVYRICWRRDTSRGKQ